jgi:hypothetical protein
MTAGRHRSVNNLDSADYLDIPAEPPGRLPSRGRQEQSDNCVVYFRGTVAAQRPADRGRRYDNE